MATQVKTSELTLAYDGDCPMCLATVGTLLRLRLVRPEQLRSNHELAGADLEAARQAGIRNQLVVLDPATGQTRAGSDGLLWIIGENTKHHLLVRLLGLPGLRQLLRVGYETVSYNRRVISPPRHQVVCDCEPEVTVGRRLMLIVPLLLATIAIVAVFAGSVAGFVLAGVPWIVMIAAALVLLRGMLFVDYVGHLAVSMFSGALVLLPAALLTFLLPDGHPVTIAVGAVSLLASFAVMFAMQRRRVAALGLSWAWLWSWAILLAATIVLAIASHFRGGMF